MWLQAAGDLFQCLGVFALGIDFCELDVDGRALRLGAQGFLEDFLCLHITAIGQVDIGFGDGVYVCTAIELAGRVGHGGGCSIRGVHVLAAAAGKEGVGVELAVAQAGVLFCSLCCTATLPGAVAQQTQQDGNQCTTGRNQRVVQQRGLFHRHGRRCWGWAGLCSSRLGRGIFGRHCWLGFVAAGSGCGSSAGIGFNQCRIGAGHFYGR